MPQACLEGDSRELGKLLVYLLVYLQPTCFIGQRIIIDPIYPDTNTS